MTTTVLLIGAASSAAALFIAKDRLLGYSYGAANGLSCETVQTVNIRKNGAIWIRKYIRMDGAAGVERIKTALRVASVTYADYQPDLVQITVLDQNGPNLRSNMRGRAIAAQVVFIPDTSKFPEEAEAHRLNGFYHDGTANTEGMFYGLRIDMPFEDLEKLASAQDKFVDCKNPDGQPPVSSTRDDAEKLVPANLGTIGPNKAPVYQEIEKDGLQDDDGEGLHDLLTSTPEHSEPSLFSIAYFKALLFGKGPSVAEAADEP